MLEKFYVTIIPKSNNFYENIKVFQKNADIRGIKSMVLLWQKLI